MISNPLWDALTCALSFPFSIFYNCTNTERTQMTEITCHVSKAFRKVFFVKFYMRCEKFKDQALPISECEVFPSIILRIQANNSDQGRRKVWNSGRGGGHCALNRVLRGHFLGIKMLQWNKSLRSFMVHYMCFDKSLFWVESRDLSQADKSNTRVSSFFEWIEWFFFTILQKKTIWHLEIWQNWCFDQF